MNIAVLGAGPAGLIAAHACRSLGHDVAILSKKHPSPVGGAMYLHKPIPNTPMELGPDGAVLYRRLGLKEYYALKVYGDLMAPVSWDSMPADNEPVDAWDLVRWYGYLWDMYEDLIQPAVLGPLSPLHLVGEYDYVINAVPLKALFPNWNYRSVEVYVTPATGIGQNSIIYDGQPHAPGCRYSCLFGKAWWESGAPMSPDSIRITKPVSVAIPSQMQFGEADWLNVGRFGKWDKNVLLSDVWDEVVNALH